MCFMRPILLSDWLRQIFGAALQTQNIHKPIQALFPSKEGEVPGGEAIMYVALLASIKLLIEPSQSAVVTTVCSNYMYMKWQTRNESW